MKERLLQEIDLIRKKYPNIQTGQNLDWVMILDFPLPPGWNRTQTKLLFLIPSTYPHTPPDNFFVEAGSRLANGEIPSNYSEGTGVPVGGNWGCFSWHSEQGGWRCADTIDRGDNLLTFVRSINMRLREGK